MHLPILELDDEKRLDALLSLELLDTEDEPEFDHVVTLVAQMTDCPVSLISLVDRDRQWFKAKFGLDVSETPRDNSFCDTAIRQGETFVIPDTLKDDRFKDNPLVVQAPHIRFYAAQPLITQSGYRIGTLCAIDVKPRQLEERQLRHLSLLALQTMRLMELRLANRRLREMHGQLQQARDEAIRANEAKSSFLANVSHEIRTPLGAILGFTNLLREENLPSKERLQFIETISRNGEALTKIIDDILDLAKVESGKLELDPVEFSPEALLTEVALLFKNEVVRKGLDFRLKISPRIPARVVSDPSRLRQILINLIGNALKFTEKGAIELSVEDAIPVPNGVRMSISVADTGIGIQAHERAKLFKPFSQANGSMSRKFGGTGLGLALSKHLAQALGGDLQLDLKSSSMTTTFVIEFVARVVSPKAIGSTNSTCVAKTHSFDFKGKNFLVTDDSEDNLYLAKRLLEKSGATVQVARGGLEAVQRGLRENFDLILMDIQMPEVDGFEAMRALRQGGFAKPIIALTAHAMKEDQSRTRDAGFDAHVSKPLNFHHLLESISGQLDPIS